MIKAILLLLVTTTLILGTYWLAQNSGNLVFDVLDYHIETPFVFALTLLVVAFILFFILLRLLSEILNLPQNFKHIINSYCKIDVAAKLEEILVAINQYDHTKAKRVLNILQKHHLPDNLLNILASEVAMIKEDIDDIKSTLLNLTRCEATKIPGFEGLISLALKEGNLSDAINYAEELARVHQSEWLVSMIVNIYMQAERWQDLINFLSNSKAASLLTKQQKKQLFAIAQYKLANNAFLALDYDLALLLATKSYKEFDEFVPTLALLARIALARQNYAETAKYLKYAWKIDPCFALTDIIAAISKNYPNDKFLAVAKNIANYNPKHYESQLIIARAALDTGRFEEASNYISAALEGNSKFRSCLIMAEYCQKTHGNIGETIDWLKRAINSEIDLNHCIYFWDFDSMGITKTPTANCFQIAKL